MRTEDFWHNSFYWITCMVVRWWLRLKYRLTVSGLENIPASGGVIVAANHCSYLDPPVLACVIPHRIVHFMARDTLCATPLSRFFFTHVQVIPIDRERGDLSALRKAISTLKAGSAIAIFPEGTRSPDGELKEAKGGIGFLIGKGSVPVVPMYIRGTFQAYPKGAKKFLPSRIQATIRKPISPDEILSAMPEKGDYQAVGDLVMDRIRQLRDIPNPSGVE